MGVIALLPWWAAVALGAVGYFVLHAFAKPGPPVSISPSDVSQAMSHAMLKGLAMAGQYIVPVLCFGAAIMSAVGRRKRAVLVSTVAQSKSSDALDGMSWQQFEILVGESFRLQGYRVVENGGAGPDGGIDLVLRKGNEKFFVQCKQWKAFKVGVQVVRELYGVMAAQGAAGGFVVTSGRFTDDAAEFAKGRNVSLLDGPKLFGLIKQAQASMSTKSAVPGSGPRAAGGEPAFHPKTPDAEVRGPTAVPPTCLVCAQTMRLRTAKRGANAGGSFWGCTGYPECKGTRPV